MVSGVRSLFRDNADHVTGESAPVGSKTAKLFEFKAAADGMTRQSPALKTLDFQFASAAMTEEYSTQTGMTLDEEKNQRETQKTKDNSLLLGLAAGNVAGVNPKLAALAKQNHEAEKRLRDQQKQASDIIAYLLNHIQKLDEKIREMEKGFEAQYGDAWREIMANEVLDPDLIPQRKEGESLEIYRERVEDRLIDQMLNDDGTIKSEYKDHPRYGKWAEWAETEFERDVASQKLNGVKKVFDNPDSTPEEKQEVIDSLDKKTLEAAIDSGVKELERLADQKADGQESEIRTLKSESSAAALI